jgi:hypothetical protein
MLLCDAFHSKSLIVSVTAAATGSAKSPEKWTEGGTEGTISLAAGTLLLGLVPKGA